MSENVTGSGDAAAAVEEGVETLSNLAAFAAKGALGLLGVAVWSLVWGAPTVLNYGDGQYVDAAIAGVVLVGPFAAAAAWAVRETL